MTATNEEPPLKKTTTCDCCGGKIHDDDLIEYQMFGPPPGAPLLKDTFIPFKMQGTNPEGGGSQKPF